MMALLFSTSFWVFIAVLVFLVVLAVLSIIADAVKQRKEKEQQ